MKILVTNSITLQGWSYQFVSGQVEPEASEGSQYWGAELLKMWYRFVKLKEGC